jgi:hypothetical protein
MSKKIDECCNGCIEHRQFLTPETDRIVFLYKQDFRIKNGFGLTKSQAINRIINEFNLMKNEKQSK